MTVPVRPQHDRTSSHTESTPNKLSQFDGSHVEGWNFQYWSSPESQPDVEGDFVYAQRTNERMDVPSDVRVLIPDGTDPLKAARLLRKIASRVEGQLETVRNRDPEEVTLRVPFFAVELIERGEPFDDVEAAIESASFELPSPLDTDEEGEKGRTELTVSLPKRLKYKILAHDDPGLYFAAAMKVHEANVQEERARAVEASLYLMQWRENAERDHEEGSDHSGLPFL